MRAQVDPEAFAVLYDQNYAPIFGYILRRVANIEIAQDITSETFYKALRNLGKFRWCNIPFSAWLYRIAGNEIANHYRKNNRQIVPLVSVQDLPSSNDPPSEIIAARDELEQHEEFLQIQAKISQLPIRYQEVIMLRFFEEKKIGEIAQILGKREGTIKSLLSRGLEKLRKSME